MKLVQDTAEGLSAAATTLTDALKKAGETASTEVGSLPPELSAVAQAVQAQLAQAATQLAELPALVDPGPITESLAEGADLARTLVGDFSAQVQAIPQGVIEQMQKVPPLLEQARSSLGEVPTVVNTLVQERDRLMALPGTLTDLSASAHSWWSQAQQTLQIFQSFANTVGSNPPAASLAQAHVLTLEQINALEAALLGECSSVRNKTKESVSQAVDSLDQAAMGAVSLTADALLTLAQQLQQCARDTAGCVRNFDTAVLQARQRLPDLSTALRKPLRQAQTALDAVGARINEAGESVLQAIELGLKPLRELPARVGRIVMALSEVLDACTQAILQVKAVLNRLLDEAALTVRRLDDIPQVFAPVRDAITQALEQIDLIKRRIPAFVSQCLGALTMASGELDQASSLCDHAIGICTRYMTKAPLLIPARALFMGIKVSIPAIKSAVAAARTAVQQAGTAAQTAMDQARALVKALEPVLDQAVTAVKAAAEALVGLIETLRSSIAQSVTQLESMLAQVRSLIEQAQGKLRQALTDLEASVKAYVEKVPVQSTLASVRAQLQSLGQTVLKPVEHQLDQLEASLAALLDKAIQGLQSQVEQVAKAIDTSAAQFDRVSAGVGQARESVMRVRSDVQMQLSNWEAQAGSGLDRVEQALTGSFDKARAQVDDLHARAQAQWARVGG